ncbi:MAG TPA: DinB family protein [Cyclobacteriaceae bacterium]|nr:DinB family protein [Cyclobacteriaceae bacterium]
MSRWASELDALSEAQLTVRPAYGGWTLGQLYMHLIADTRFYVEQIRICLASNDHADGKMTSEAEEMFRNNSFPDIRIEGDPSHASMRQPESKREIMQGFMDVRSAMEQVAEEIAVATHHGKTRHPGFGYFSAQDWFQFADMHLRHHERQKRRIVEGSR